MTVENDGTTMQFETNGFTTLFILNDLHPFYVYYIEIAAYTVGIGPTASALERTHPDGQPCNVTSYHGHVCNAMCFFY